MDSFAQDEYVKIALKTRKGHISWDAGQEYMTRIPTLMRCLKFYLMGIPVILLNMRLGSIYAAPEEHTYPRWKQTRQIKLRIYPTL